MARLIFMNKKGVIKIVLPADFKLDCNGADFVPDFCLTENLLCKCYIHDIIYDLLITKYGEYTLAMVAEAIIYNDILFANNKLVNAAVNKYALMRLKWRYYYANLRKK